MVRTFVAGRAGVSALAAAHGVHVRVLDLGVDDDLDGVPADVTAHKVRRGSGAIHLEDALTAEETHARAGRRGRRRPRGDRRRRPAAAQRRHGHRQHHARRGPGRRGASGCRPPRSPAAAPASTTPPWPASRQLVQQALDRAGDRADDPVDTLTALGSADLAATTGYLVAAADAGRPGAARRADVRRLRADRRPDRARVPRPGSPPATAPPSRPSRSRSTSSASSRCSTSGCGWARAAARSPPYPCCAAPSPCCATSRCSPSSCLRMRDAWRLAVGTLTALPVGAARPGRPRAPRAARCCSRRSPCCRSGVAGRRSSAGSAAAPDLPPLAVAFAGRRRARGRQPRAALGRPVRHRRRPDRVLRRRALAGRDEVRHLRPRRRGRVGRGARDPGRRARGVRRHARAAPCWPACWSAPPGWR